MVTGASTGNLKCDGLRVPRQENGAGGLVDISKSLLSHKAGSSGADAGKCILTWREGEREKKGFFKNNVSTLIKMLTATPFDPWNRPHGNMTDVCEVVGMVFMATRLIIKKENQP